MTPMCFYRVSPHAHPTYWWAEPDPYPEDMLNVFCGRRNPAKTIRYVIRCGRWPGHIVGSAAWSVELIRALKRCKATGYATFPIEVWLHGVKPVPGYVGLRVFGRGGAFDPTRSGAEYLGNTLIAYRATYMHESDWDGRDVFTIPGLGIGVFVVERVARELTRLKLKNVSLVKNTECSSP
jgi:hypothetical protein